MLDRERLVTAEEFAGIPDDDHRYELVAGRVIRMSPPGSRHAALVTRLAIVIGQHVEAHGLGAILSSGGFKLASNPDTVREPDLAFIARERLPDAGLPDGFWPGPPDLAIEVRSPGDRSSEILAKVREYLGCGVRRVWVVDGKKRTITVHTASSAPITLGVGDSLDAGDVVTGFTCPVRRIFD
jgi:Uma2 family endonuclease